MGNRLSKIYTRTGDKGTTGLGDGSRVDKNSLRVEAFGTVDELNSAVGLVLATGLPEDVRACLTRTQHELFDLGGELCMPGYTLVPGSYIDGLEKALDGFNKTCRHLRILSCRGAPRLPPAVTWPAPSRAAQNDV